MKFVYGSVAVVVLMCAAAYPTADSLESTLLAREKMIIDAIKNGNEQVLTEMLADQIYSVTADKGRESKSELLRSLAKAKIGDYGIREVKVFKVSEDVAILSYHFSWKGTQDGKTVESNVYATSTWAQSEGVWRPVFYQETAAGN